MFEHRKDPGDVKGRRTEKCARGGLETLLGRFVIVMKAESLRWGIELVK